MEALVAPEPQFGSPTFASVLAREMADLMADGVVTPLGMLEALQRDGRYRTLNIELVARQMRALTGDTTQLARQIVRARSAQTMLEVLNEGEPRDKIQVLAKWGPEPNVEDGRGGLTIVVGGNAQVQVNIGSSALSPLLKSDKP